MTSNLQNFKYEQTPWGEIIAGTKEKLQSLGIAVGMAFPGEPGGPKRELSVRDPRGFKAKVTSCTSAGVYHARIRLPGRERPINFQERTFATGVMVRERSHGDEYIGCAYALVAAGLMQADQFPGQPGMRKVTVTIFADGTLPNGAPNANCSRARETGAKRVQRASKTTFSVSVTISDDVAKSRWAAERTAEDEWKVRMLALPRPAPLSSGSSYSARCAGNVVDLQAVRMAREQALTARQIEQRVPPLNAKARMVDTNGDERRCLWVSQTEAEFLSHMYQHGPEAAAKRLMQIAGKSWPEHAPT